MRITGVPLHESDLVRQSCTHGFTITEAWSPPRKIPAHAHAMLSITVLLQGDFEERYQSNFRPNTCVKGSLLIRPAGEIHENSLGNKGGRTLSIELDPAHFEKYGSSIAALQSLTLLREAAFLDIGIAMSCELRHTDQAAALALESLGLELLARLTRVREFRAAGRRSPMAQPRPRFHRRSLLREFAPPRRSRCGRGSPSCLSGPRISPRLQRKPGRISSPHSR